MKHFCFSFFSGNPLISERKMNLSIQNMAKSFSLDKTQVWNTINETSYGHNSKNNYMCDAPKKKFKLQHNSNLFVLIMSDHEKNNVL